MNNKYEAMMQQKRMIGESQALLNQKYAEKQAQKKNTRKCSQAFDE